MLGPTRTMTEEKMCECCYEDFVAWRYDTHDHCPSCRQMLALERIAEAIEYWIGHR